MASAGIPADVDDVQLLTEEEMAALEQQTNEMLSAAPGGAPIPGWDSLAAPPPRRGLDRQSSIERDFGIVPTEEQLRREQEDWAAFNQPVDDAPPEFRPLGSGSLAVPASATSPTFWRPLGSVSPLENHAFAMEQDDDGGGMGEASASAFGAGPMAMEITTTEETVHLSSGAPVLVTTATRRRRRPRYRDVVIDESGTAGKTQQNVTRFKKKKPSEQTALRLKHEKEKKAARDDFDLQAKALEKRLEERLGFEMVVLLQSYRKEGEKRQFFGVPEDTQPNLTEKPDPVAESAAAPQRRGGRTPKVAPETDRQTYGRLYARAKMAHWFLKRETDINRTSPLLVDVLETIVKDVVTGDTWKRDTPTWYGRRFSRMAILFLDYFVLYMAFFKKNHETNPPMSEKALDLLRGDALHFEAGLMPPEVYEHAAYLLILHARIKDKKKFVNGLGSGTKINKYEGRTGLLHGMRHSRDWIARNRPSESGTKAEREAQASAYLTRWFPPGAHIKYQKDPGLFLQDWAQHHFAGRSSSLVTVPPERRG